MPLTISQFPILTPKTITVMEEILASVRSAKHVQLIGHHRPDGDCIGSLLALHHLLAQMGVASAMATADHVYEGYRLIPGYDKIETTPREGYHPDLVLFSDCADRNRAFPDWNAGSRVIVIDHHGSNTNFGNTNWIEPGCAATAEMVYYLWVLAGLKPKADAANAMLLGIMTDTGSLRFSNVRPVHFEICAELLRAGADVTLISKAAYETRPAQSVKLGATILSAVEFLSSGALAWSEARQSDLSRLGGMEKLPENLINDIRSIQGVRVAALFTETSDGGVRVSLRGDGSLSVSQIAGEFGGGGHPNAAGITIDSAPYEPTRDKVLARIAEVLKETSPS